MDEKLQPKYVFPIFGIDWSGGAGRPCGVYYLGGQCRIVPHGSLAEEVLLARGAFLVATLRFDKDPYEAAHPGHTVERLEARAALREFAP